MKLYVLTPIYATTTSSQGETPVVHYFAREWVKMGHDVTVFHLTARYPRLYYLLGKIFQHKLNSRLGILIPVKCPQEDDYIAEGVTIHRICLKKIKPHSVYTAKELKKAYDYITSVCETSGLPDWFIGHWDNPQLELLTSLKKRYAKPVGIVFHNNQFNFLNKYGESGIEMLKEMDAIGFRSHISKKNFILKFGDPKYAFIVFSGVSEAFLDAGLQTPRSFSTPPHSFIYVGSLIARKHPSAILSALSSAYPDGDFTMTFIGDGAERISIEEEYHRLGCPGNLCFVGRIPREDIIRYLKKSDVFIMISSGEIFGLVYLEAMALGLIPVGSRNEGIDGIICNGKNGFLCDAGNAQELGEIIKRLKNMSSDELKVLSDNARKTAMDYSDASVARTYIDSLSSIT